MIKKAINWGKNNNNKARQQRRTPLECRRPPRDAELTFCSLSDSISETSSIAAIREAGNYPDRRQTQEMSAPPKPPPGRAKKAAQSPCQAPLTEGPRQNDNQEAFWRLGGVLFPHNPCFFASSPPPLKFPNLGCKNRHEPL